MYSDPAAGAAKNSNHVTAVHLARKLEVLDVRVPFGQFRSVISGPSIAPDPGFGFVAGGRLELQQAGVEAAAQAVRHVCEQYQAGEHHGDLLSLRPDLIRFIATCRDNNVPPPFDLGELLGETPLFRTTRGVWLSLNQLDTIAVDGKLPFAQESGRPGVLDLASQTQARALCARTHRAAQSTTPQAADYSGRSGRGRGS
jgi:hypothetical protein